MSGVSTDGRERDSVLVCLNPNPSIDRVLMLDELVVGGVNRATKSLDAVGGKGAIAARTAQNLGYRAVCCGPIGGSVGDTVRKLAEDEALAAVWHPIAGQTRVNTTIVSNGGTPVDTVVNEAGPVLSAEEWDGYCALAAELPGNGGVACISGSLPTGIDQHQAQALVEVLTARGCKVFVDTYGSWLEAMARARPWCIKINHLEAAAFTGTSIDSQADAAREVQKIADHVTGIAVITLGGDGAVCATGDGLVVHVSPAPVESVSAVGSGDAFLAGLATGVLSLRSLEDALRWAAASGAANARAGGQGAVDLHDVEALTGTVEVTVLQSGSST